MRLTVFGEKKFWEDLSYKAVVKFPGPLFITIRTKTNRKGLFRNPDCNLTGYVLVRLSYSAQSMILFTKL